MTEVCYIVVCMLVARMWDNVLVLLIRNLLTQMAVPRVWEYATCTRLVVTMVVIMVMVMVVVVPVAVAMEAVVVAVVIMVVVVV